MYWGFHWVLLPIMNFCECSLFWEICINSLLGITFHIVLYVHLNSYFFLFLLFNLFDSVRDMLKSIPIPIVDLPTFHFFFQLLLYIFGVYFLLCICSCSSFSTIYFCSLSFMPWSLFYLILTLLFRLIFDLFSALLILVS